MPSPNSTFKGEIMNFRLDDYIPHMGWIGRNPSRVKIYRREDSSDYYLHDEILNRLFAFTYESKQGLMQKWEFEGVVEAYYLMYPGNRIN